MPGLEDRYVIQLTVQELEELILKVKHEGGIAYENNVSGYVNNALKQLQEYVNSLLTAYVLKKDLISEESKWIPSSYLIGYSESIKNDLIGTDNDTKDKITIKGTLKAAQSFATDALTSANKYTDTKLNSGNNLPKASITEYGVVKIGTGLIINDEGKLNVTGQGITVDAVDWNNVVNKPTSDNIENDQYYKNLISKLGKTALSNSYNDLDNKPDLNTYKLPIASTTSLGGVMIDGKTITISNTGVIKAQDAGAEIAWIRYTE